MVLLFRPSKFVALLLFFLLIGASACSVGSSNSDKTPTSNAQPVATSTNAVSPSPTAGAATPDDGLGTPVVPQTNRLLPPDLILHAKAGEQLGNFGAWFWQNSYGLVADTHAVAYEIQPDMTQLAQGEEISFTWRYQNSQSDTTLQTVDLTVYPAAGNTKSVPTSGKTLTGFWPQTDATTKATLTPASPSWSVNLPSGEYFIVVHATWSNPIGDHHERDSDYSFHVQVP